LPRQGMKEKVVDRLRVERSIPKETGLQPAAVASAAHDPWRNESI